MAWWCAPCSVRASATCFTAERVVSGKHRLFLIPPFPSVRIPLLSPGVVFQLSTLSALALAAGTTEAQSAAGKARTPAKRMAALTNGTPAFRTSDSVQLFVKIAGRGMPCVLVPGGPGAGTFVYENLGVRALEDRL